MMSDTLFVNGRFYSLEREGEHFAALQAGPDGRIRRLYGEGEALPPVPRRVDLGGAAAVPGFIDSHVHFMAKAALGALGVNLARLEGDRIVPDCLEAVRAALAERADAGPGLVLGYALCLGAVAERRLPRASELDAWFPGRSVVVLSMDGHSSAYSGPALDALGLRSSAEDGVLAGEAHEFNMGKLSALVLRSLGPRALARGLAAVYAEAAASGLVSIHCLEGTEDAPKDPALALFKLLGGTPGPRLRLWMQYTDPGRARRNARGLERLRVGGCMAWEMDGSVSSRTAAFDRNYLDRDHGGRLYRSPEEARALVRPFYEAGIQTSAHAIGPRGIESILSAYEGLMDEAGDRENRLRLRIDHFEFPRPDQVARAGARRLILTVQPGFAWADDRYIHGYAEALAPEIRSRQCPLRDLLDAGCVPVLSTDAPVQPFNPFIQIAGAVRHPAPAQRLTVYEALRAYTWAGAYAAFEEGDRGSLAPRKFADFAVLDRDPFAAEADRIQDVRVLSAWHEGRPLRAPPSDLPLFAAHLLGARLRALLRAPFGASRRKL